MKTFFLYRHIRPDKNEVFYIGIGSYQKKWKYQRSLTTKNRNIHWKRIVDLCKEDFESELLFDELTQEEVILKEKEFIKIYGRSDLKLGSLCNTTDGGEGIFNLSQEGRKKISDSRLGSKNPMYGKKQSEDHISKRMVKMVGENNPNYGISLPEWQKEINRKAQLGRVHSKETIELRVSQIRKKVIDTFTGEIFPSILDASIRFGKSSCQMSRDIKRNNYNLKFI